MKTVLFLALLSPLAAHASYQCQGDVGTLEVSPVDPTHVTATFNSESFTGEVSSSDGHVFRSTKYALVSSEGKSASLTVTVMPILTRGGGFCGRAGCDSGQPLEHISASLVVGSDQPFEFMCSETLDVAVD